VSAVARSGSDTASENARVCVVTSSLPPAYGGAELAALRYAVHRNGAGGATLLVAPAPETGPGSDPLPDFVHPVAVPRPARGARGTGSRVAAATRFVTVARSLWPRLFSLRHEFDIVHVFNGAPIFNLMAIPLARVLGKPVVLDLSLMGSDDPLTVQWGRSGPGRRRWRPRAAYMLYRLADVLVSKPGALDDACRRTGFWPDRVTAVPYGVDLARFRPATALEQQELRAALGLDPDAVIVLFVGGINERKGVHVLLEAFRALLARVADVHLLVIGPAYKYDSGYVETLHRNARQWGIQHRVTFLEGVTTNVHEYMRAADVFVLPSRREGLPISILEAMACGLAVIGSDIPEIASTQIRDGRTGLLFPVGDAAALTRTLERVATDAGERHRLGHAAHERAVSEFGNDQVMRRYDELYRRLLHKGKVRGRASLRSHGAGPSGRPTAGPDRPKLLLGGGNAQGARK
jgi:glycosyltransferase involved in cell wall biosynthesis